MNNSLHQTVIHRPSGVPAPWVVVSTIDMEPLGVPILLLGYRCETMVFPCDVSGTVLNFSDLDVARCQSIDGADSMHADMVSKWTES